MWLITLKHIQLHTLCHSLRWVTFTGHNKAALVLRRWLNPSQRRHHGINNSNLRGEASNPLDPFGLDDERKLGTERYSF